MVFGLLCLPSSVWCNGRIRWTPRLFTGLAQTPGRRSRRSWRDRCSRISGSTASVCAPVSFHRKPERKVCNAPHWGTLLSVRGFLPWPCYLIITLPLLLSLLAGTALGRFLSQHTGL